MPKIVIVEDDPMIADIYQKKFAESGFEVLLANAGDQALAMCKKEGVEAILLDMVIPKMSGFDVIKSLRSDGYNPSLRIIGFSNLGSSEDRGKAMELGANGYIIKSDYTPTALVQEISRLLAQYKEEEENGKKDYEEDKEGKTAASSSASSALGKKILMMEDEEVFREMFGGKLKQDGFDVDFAENGAVGLKKSMSEDYHLYIVDMIMPFMSGEEIVAKLKLEEKTKNIPVIILSASVDEREKEKMEKSGVAAFFIKTQLVPSELSKKVEELLS